MANNYLQFSFAVPNITPPEAAWLQAYLTRVATFAEYEDEDNTPDTDPVLSPDDEADPFLMAAKENGSFGFSWELDQDGLWIYAEESGDPDTAALLVQKFLAVHRPQSYVGFEWAVTCSKMRLDEFGGGAVMVTATVIHWLSTSNWIQDQSTRLQETGLTAA